MTNPKDSPLDPEVEDFARWFADWWLRRGSRLYAAAKEADPEHFNERKSKPAENRLPLRWDGDTGRLVLDKDRKAEPAADSPRPRHRSDDPAK